MTVDPSTSAPAFPSDAPPDHASDVLDLLQPRWERLWTALDEHGLDALVSYGTDSVKRFGAVTWLTGLLPPGGGVWAVIKPGHAPVLVAVSSMERHSLQASLDCPLPVETADAPGRTAQLELVVRLAGPGRVGTVSPATGAPSLRRAVAEASTSTGLVSAEDLFARERRRTTTLDHLEQRLVAADLDSALLRFAGTASAGITEAQAAAILEADLVAGGLRLRIVQISAGHFHGQRPSTRTLLEGDVVTVFVEAAGRYGHWVEIGVVFHVGEVTDRLRTQSTALVDDLAIFASRLAPGPLDVALADLHHALSDIGPATINLGHGVGVDELDWSIGPNSATVLAGGDSLAAHPSCQPRDDPARAFAVANTFLIGADQATALSTLPFTIHHLPRT